MELHVRDVQQAEEALESLNRLHDGFIKRLLLESGDSFDVAGSQHCTGDLSVVILFAHYNFAGERRPSTQAVEATFVGVKDLELSLGGRNVEWNVYDFSVREETRTSDLGEREPCLAAYLVAPRLSPAGEWSTRQCRLFTFREAVFRDVHVA
ncbi:MAG: hypothetical protein L6Q95_09725 [Planctomycetes bacterium]|nr:hypothetical protein [Planctomycetota bacterium]